jgi:outer membrane protein
MLFLGISSVTEAGAAEEKVGGLDPGKVLSGHPLFEQAREQLNTIADKKQQEVKTAIDKETDNKKKQELFQKMNQELATEEQKLMQPLFKDINIAIRKVAADKNVTVVVDKAALLYGGVDITDDVLQELKRVNTKGN